MASEVNTLKPNNEEKKYVFQNPVIEKLTRTHIAVPISILGSAALFILFWGIAKIGLSILSVFLLFIGGFLAFTLIEYLIHRNVFHMDTDNEFKSKIQYNVHGIHHDYPKDKERLAMPPLLSAVLAAVFFLFFRLIMNDYAYAFMPGFLLGYTAYLFVHYIVHAWPPPNNIFRELWVHHSIHHYKDHHRAYGVSSPLWDFIFRTMPKRKKK